MAFHCYCSGSHVQSCSVMFKTFCPASAILRGLQIQSQDGGMLHFEPTGRIVNVASHIHAYNFPLDPQKSDLPSVKYMEWTVHQICESQTDRCYKSALNVTCTLHEVIFPFPSPTHHCFLNLVQHTFSNTFIFGMITHTDTQPVQWAVKSIMSMISASHCVTTRIIIVTYFINFTWWGFMGPRTQEPVRRQ